MKFIKKNNNYEKFYQVWILTGDKLETAINIGYACKLLNEKFINHIVDEDDFN